MYGLTVARGHIGNFGPLSRRPAPRWMRAATRASRHEFHGRGRQDHSCIAESRRPLREYTDRYVAALDAPPQWASSLSRTRERPSGEPAGVVDSQRARRAQPRVSFRGIGVARISTQPETGKLAARHENQRRAAGLDHLSARRATSCCGRPPSPGADVGPGAAPVVGLAHRVLGHGAAAPRPGADRFMVAESISCFRITREIARSEGAPASSSRDSGSCRVSEPRQREDVESVGSVFTVRDILDKGHRASALRYL